MKIIIVGAGDIGQALVNVLASKGHEVTLIESNKEIAEKSAENSDALVLQGEPTNMRVLKDAKIEKADAIISLTKDDKSNLMVSEIAKSMEIPKIIARVSDPENEELFTKLGVDDIIPIVSLALRKIENSLFVDKYRVLAELGKGKLQIIEIPIKKGSKLIGKFNIKDVPINAIYRNGDYIIPNDKISIQEGDVLIITISSRNIEGLVKKLSGT
jgi:trk system potassium uptake protein TrkA